MKEVYQASKKLSSWPMLVVDLTKRRDELIKENRELTEENMALKRKCSELWREVTEERARNDS
tara:strand:- start:285 stop:473 length:189 start_codon:yes stop_codon:yes gene_type:complete